MSFANNYKRWWLKLILIWYLSALIVEQQWKLFQSSMDDMRAHSYDEERVGMCVRACVSISKVLFLSS